MCLIGKTQLLCMQCRGIGPLLSLRGKFRGFSRVAAVTLGIFSRYGGMAIQNSCIFSDVRTPV